MITKTQVLMDHIPSDDEDAGLHVTFVTDLNDDETPGLINRTLILQVGMWEEMGRPEQVTVTIEPGDRLNDDPASQQD